MENHELDPNLALTLDGNALAGALYDIFQVEMTVAPVECATCGREGEMGSLLVFDQAPGFILRCPACLNIILRIVLTPNHTYLDTRGAAFLCIPRNTVQ